MTKLLIVFFSFKNTDFPHLCFATYVCHYNHPGHKFAQFLWCFGQTFSEVSYLCGSKIERIDD